MKTILAIMMTLVLVGCGDTVTEYIPVNTIDSNTTLPDGVEDVTVEADGIYISCGEVGCGGDIYIGVDIDNADNSDNSDNSSVDSNDDGSVNTVSDINNTTDNSDNNGTITN